MCCRSLRDARAYRAWLAWSHKPDSMRHVVPSQHFFSLGRTSAFSGDLAAEGTLDAMLKVRGSRRGAQHWNMAQPGLREVYPAVWGGVWPLHPAELLQRGST